MSFAVGADAYDRFMGRYSGPLAPVFADFAGLTGGSSALDVGCGPGALTTELVGRLGVESVSAIDPSESFVAAAMLRHPGVVVHHGSAEQLPFADEAFDAALAQLVVHFMKDPVAGLGEMRRVTASGGVVAACVWDHASGGGPLTLFWDAARDLNPENEGEAVLSGTRQGHLGELFAAAGVREVQETELWISVEHATFEEWWEPFTFGVGPAGAYAARLGDAGRDELRERCRELVPVAPFAVSARAWAARGRA